MAYLKPNEKSKIVKDLLKQYLQTAIEGANETPISEIECEENTVGFDECHVYLKAEEKEGKSFDVNRDVISNGAEVPPFLNDFPVYMIFEKQNDKILWRVWAYWGDIEFK